MRWFLLLLLPLWACSPASADQAQKPEGDPIYPVQAYHDLAYYTGPDRDTVKHALNLFVPEGVENPPVMLWIHGGAWAFGGRTLESELATRFAEAGVAVAAMSYRLSPATWADPPKAHGVQHPAHIEDVARAFAWLKAHGAEYGIATDQIFVSGYSAGGHLSALLALDGRYLAAHQLCPTDILGVIPVAGAYDLEAYHQALADYRGMGFADAHVKGVFGSAEGAFEVASPTTYLEHSQVPMWVISEGDTYNYTLTLERAVKAQNVPHITFTHWREENHQSLATCLAQPDCEYREAMVQWIRDHAE